MGLGRREARHQSVAAAKVAGVDPSVYWEYQPGQKVMTADGFAGVVASVDDGPFAGNETYEVTLDNGMGGGQYTASLLRAMPQTKANVDIKTAADDYPELGSILEDRPPLQMSVASSLQTTAQERCNCEHASHFPDDFGGNSMAGTDPGAHTYRSVDAGEQSAQHVGKVCDQCAQTCMAAYLKTSSLVVAHDANEERPSTEYPCAHVYCGKPQVPGAKVCSEHMRVTENEKAWITDPSKRTGSLEKQAWDKEEWDEANDGHDDHRESCLECGGEGQIDARDQGAGVGRCEACDGSGKEPLGRRGAARFQPHEHPETEEWHGSQGQCEGTMCTSEHNPENQVPPVAPHVQDAIRNRFDGQGSYATMHPDKPDTAVASVDGEPHHVTIHGDGTYGFHGYQGKETFHQDGCTLTQNGEPRHDPHGWHHPDDDTGWKRRMREEESYREGSKKTAAKCENCGHATTDHQHQKCYVCQGEGVDWAAQETCGKCGGYGTIPATRKSAAYDEGDPEKYTSEHSCPSCHSPRALESATGVIKCEDCGYEQNNGDQDGYSKSAAEHCTCETKKPYTDGQIKVRCSDCHKTIEGATDAWSDAQRKQSGFKDNLNGWLDMHIRPTPKQPVVAMPPVSFRTCRCQDCKEDRAAREADYYGHTASAQPITHDSERFPSGATCARCGFSHRDAAPGQECALCGGQMSRMPDKVVHALLEDPYRLLIVAAADSEFRFHVTASYSDVRKKAKRLRAAGNVNIISVGSGVGTIVANVKGDTAVYETEIVRMGSNAIAQWHCGCKWGSYAWGRSPAFKKFEGRLCSHALALHFEAQSRGMFGRQMNEDKTTPDWLRPRTRVVVDFNKDDRKNVSRPAVPRKRDMRSYSMVNTDESPLTTLVRTAQNEGVEMEEVLVSLAAAGIDGRSFYTLAEIKTDPEPPKSHHKNRAGDLMPCARGGCGHPEGIHGEEAGRCQSPGCECGHYQSVHAPKKGSLDAEAKGKAKHHTKHHTVHHHVHHMHAHPAGFATHPGGWGGYGYGFPMIGLGGGCSYCGTDGSGGGDSGGSVGDGGDGGGSEGVRKTADAQMGLGTMDPTYTEGNDPRPWEGNHGVWQATSPPDHSANPGSTGWASGADPKEFDQDSSAFGREGSLNWPRLQTEAGNPLNWGRNLLHAPQMWTELKNVRNVEQAGKYTNNYGAGAANFAGGTGGRTNYLGAEAPKGDYKPASGSNEMPKWLRAADENFSPFSLLPKNVRNKIGHPGANDAEANDAAQHPLGWMANEVGNGLGKGLYKATEGLGITEPVADALTGAGHAATDVAKGVGKGVQKGWKKLFGSLETDWPTMQTEAWAGPIGPWVDHKLERGVVDLGKPLLHDVENLAGDAAGTVKGWAHDLNPFGGGGKPSVPHPRSAPVEAPPKPGAPAPMTPQAPVEPVPMKPGSGTPIKTEPEVHPQTAADGAKSAPKGKPGGQTREEGSGRAGKPPKEEKPASGKAREEGKGRRPRRSPRMPGLKWPGAPDYTRVTELLKGMLPAPHAASLEVFALLAEEEELLIREASGLAELHEEPEAALPTTDGAGDPDEETDPDGETDGLASHGSVDDIVAQFQATAGAAALVGGGDNSPGESGDDVASAARSFLQTEAMKTFTPSEQKSIIDEGMDVTASNLDRLDIGGTHYEALEAALASQTDDDDLEF